VRGSKLEKKLIMDSKEQKEFWKKLDKEDKEVCDYIFKKTGFRVKSIDDFTNKSDYNYDIAIPAICECLNNDYEQNIYEMLLRGLINKKAKGIANVYVFDFFERRINKFDDVLVSVIGMVIKVIVIESDYDRLYKIIKNAKQYVYISIFIAALAKLKSNKEKTKNLVREILNKKGLAVFPITYQKTLAIYNRLAYRNYSKSNVN
jgi:hypothetical protein